MLVIGNTSEARRLADRLSARVAILEHEVFPDGEVMMHLTDDAREDDVLLYYQFSRQESLDAQILRLMALLRSLNNRAGIRLVLPYFPYARSLPWGNERVVTSAEPMLAAIKNQVRELWTIDLHCANSVLQPYVGEVKVSELSLRATIASFLQEKFTEVVLVAPDRGAENRVRNLAALLKVSYLAMNKQRRSATEVVVEMPKGFYKTNKQYIIVDDIISTGKTFAAAIAQLRQSGIDQVAGVITHNVARVETIQSFVADGVPIFTSNSTARDDWHFDVLESVVEAAQQIKLAV
ncbi:MAG: ribose-phosphate diphosphokinase [Patescibacteria group bacterium]|jgi:ribose-phosphate pyrophosphokinase